MDRYSAAFSRLSREHRLGFCPFSVLGDPTPRECLERIKKYIAAKPDFLELGIPFSDPIADGKEIQAASGRALKSGTTPRKAVALVRIIRAMLSAAKSDIPIGILTYANIPMRYGIDGFYRDLSSAGADSVLIADVPLEEIEPFASAGHRHCLHQIFIVSEYVAAARLKQIEKYAGGFLYVVSRLGVTGIRANLPSTLKKLIERLKQSTKLPLMVGFGISKPAHMRAVRASGAEGAIVGSALVQTPFENLTQKLDFLRPNVKHARTPNTVN